MHVFSHLRGLSFFVDVFAVRCTMVHSWCLVFERIVGGQLLRGVLIVVVCVVKSHLGNTTEGCK